MKGSGTLWIVKFLYYKRVGLITKGKSVKDGREDYVINEKEKKVSKIKAFTDTFH